MRLKITPYFVDKKPPFSLESLTALLQLESESPEEVRDHALAAWTCFSSMRMEDVDYAKTNEFTIKAADTNNARRIVAVLRRTKNDKTGTGPVAGRTFVLPCICMEGLIAPEKKAFAKKQQQDQFCACLSSCPFKTVKKYLDACPVAAACDEAAFMRALTARGTPRGLTTNKLGYNQLVGCLEKVQYKSFLCLVLKLLNFTNQIT